MELRQLEYLVAVAEEANFTRAAERVHISQSGVSAQIRRLEQDLGAVLIDRSGRRALLTPAGAAALQHARAALGSVDTMRKAVDDVTGLVRGRLVIGMVVGCRIIPLFEALARFHRDHPGVDMALVEGNSDRLIEQVRTGQIDLALVATADAPPPELDGFPIVTEQLVAAVPLGHPLAHRHRARLADLTEHPIVCLPVGTGIRTAFDSACAARGIQPAVALEASAPDSVAALAARGLGVAILSESIVTEEHERLEVLAIEDSDATAMLGVVWASTPSPALHELARCCREAFDQG